MIYFYLVEMSRLVENDDTPTHFFHLVEMIRSVDRACHPPRHCEERSNPENIFYKEESASFLAMTETTETTEI